MDDLNLDPEFMQSLLGGLKQDSFKDDNIHKLAKEKLIEQLEMSSTSNNSDIISVLYTIVKETA